CSGRDEIDPSRSCFRPALRAAPLDSWAFAEQVIRGDERSQRLRHRHAHAADRHGRSRRLIMRARTFGAIAASLALFASCGEPLTLADDPALDGGGPSDGG